MQQTLKIAVFAFAATVAYARPDYSKVPELEKTNHGACTKEVAGVTAGKKDIAKINRAICDDPNAAKEKIAKANECLTPHIVAQLEKSSEPDIQQELRAKTTHEWHIFQFTVFNAIVQESCSGRLTSKAAAYIKDNESLIAEMIDIDLKKAKMEVLISMSMTLKDLKAKVAQM